MDTFAALMTRKNKQSGVLSPDADPRLSRHVAKAGKPCLPAPPLLPSSPCLGLSLALGLALNTVLSLVVSLVLGLVLNWSWARRSFLRV